MFLDLVSNFKGLQGLDSLTKATIEVVIHLKLEKEVNGGDVQPSKVAKAAVPTQNQPNTSRQGAGNQFQSGNFKCFKCGEPSHKSSDCRKTMGERNRALLMEEIDENVCFDMPPTYDQPLNEEIGGDCDEEEGMALMLKKTLLVPKQESEEDWLRTNIFYTTCSVDGRVCNMIIDGGSCENVVSQEVVDKLKLPTQEHANPYKLSWFKKRNEVRVTKRCLVSFSI